MRLLALLGLIGLLFIALAGWHYSATARVPETVTASPYVLERVKNNDWLLIDVRSPEEFAEGHIPGAINMPHEQITGYLSELTGWQDKPVIVYCRSGRRASMAMQVLEQHNFSALRALEGDMLGWNAANLPVTRM